jgi:hypothetical protein
MKPGMQRDILVAYWLLFDEFGIGDDDLPAPSDQPNHVTPTTNKKETEKPMPRTNGGKALRRS